MSGPADWKGGIAQAEPWNDPAKKNSTNDAGAMTLPVELGINRVLIRATNAPGNVHHVARADGLKTAEMDIVSHPAPVVKDGLSGVFAEDFQSSDLSRGPTALTQSYRPIFRTINVTSITAGSNSAAAFKSHDDNEASAWTSDGKPENSWIEYTFEHPDTVSRLSLKLVGWRLRTYPIRVTLDGALIYEGSTLKSLGYINLPVTPVTGQHLRISLTGPTNDIDAFGNVVEINSDKAVPSAASRTIPSGWKLGIVEADILGPVSKDGSNP